MNSYTVQLHGDYFTMTTTVDATNPDNAYKNAVAFLKDHYGFDWAATNVIRSWDYDYNGASVDDLWDIDNDCVHDWSFVDGSETTMVCAHCGHFQN